MIELYVIVGLCTVIIALLCVMIALAIEILTKDKPKDKQDLPDYDETFDGWNSRDTFSDVRQDNAKPNKCSKDVRNV